MKKLFIFLTLLLSVHVLADDVAKQNLIERLEGQQTLSADFEQRTYGNDNSADVSTGFFKIAKPMRFVWFVTSPFEQQVISDGETLWVFDPDLEQATYQPAADTVSQSPAMILAQPRAALADQYDVLEAGNDNLTAFRLYPTDNEALFREITLLFNAEQIEEIRILDSVGQETVITLRNVRVNETFEDDTFEFSPPEGTDLFEQM